MHSCIRQGIQLSRKGLEEVRGLVKLSVSDIGRRIRSTYNLDPGLQGSLEYRSRHCCRSSLASHSHQQLTLLRRGVRLELNLVH